MKTIFFWIAITVISLTSFKGHSNNTNTKRTTTVLTQNQFATGEIIRLFYTANLSQKLFVQKTTKRQKWTCI